MPEKLEKTEVKPTSLKSLRAKRDELNEEYRLLGVEASIGNGAALQRRSEISRELRAVSLALHEREPNVEVVVPRSATGHPFRLGEAMFLPGKHTVKKSVAQYLMWLIDKNREDEVNRLKQNGETFRLPAVGGQASQIDEGRD